MIHVSRRALLAAPFAAAVTRYVRYERAREIAYGILEGDSDAIRIGMQQKISHSFLFEEYLHRLYKEGKIDLDNARLFSTEKSILDQMLMGTYSVPRLDSIKSFGQH